MSAPDFKGTFMSTFIAASPDTDIVEMDAIGNVLRTPVIAWAPDAENPYRAPHPITLTGIARMTENKAIEFPNGMVHDPSYPICFGSVDEWHSAVAKRADAKREAPATKAPKAEPPAGSEPAIEWSSQPFKQNSFYRYNDGAFDFIFQVEGGINPPKQKGAVTKIKRDEFMSLKKSMDVAEAEDLMRGVFPGIDEIGDYDLDEDPDNLVGAAEYEGESFICLI